MDLSNHISAVELKKKAFGVSHGGWVKKFMNLMRESRIGSCL
jgi:hypothetical protein